MRWMSLSDTWFLYRARLRARAVLVQEGFAITGIAVGVALLFASQVASTSLTHSVARMTRQIVGNTQFQLDARGPGGFAERLLPQVQRIPGMRIALPVVEQQADAIAPHGEQPIELIGTDPRFAHFAGPLLRRFSTKQLAAQQAVALPAPLAGELGVGSLETIELRIGARLISILVGATLTNADIGELSHSPVAVAPVRYVQRIAGMEGRVSRIFIEAQPGREHEVQVALRTIARKSNLNLEPSNFDSILFTVAASPANQSETLFSAISALVGFMFALNAMLMTVPARRRVIEDVRRQGATRMMAVQILAFDAVVLGVLACGAGLVLGDLLSIAAFHSSPGYLSFAFPVGNQRIVRWQSVAVAVLAGFVAAGLGVCWPLRDLIARPIHMVKPNMGAVGNLGSIRLAGGLAGLLVTVIVLTFRPQSASVGIVTLVIALLCLLPPLFDGVVNVFEWLQRPFNRTSPLLAVIELRTTQIRIRSLAIAATGAVAVFGVAAIEGAQHNLERGLAQSARAVDSSTALWITPGGSFDPFATIPFQDIASRAIARVLGVRDVSLYRGSFMDWGDRRVWVLAPSGNQGQILSANQLIAGDLTSATERLRHGGWIVLSSGLAAENRIHVEDTVTLPSSYPMRLRVAALSTNFGWAPGAIIMNSRDYARAWGSGSPSAYEVRLRPGATPFSERRLIQRQLGPRSPFEVETSSERMRRHDATTRQGLSRLTEIRLLVLIAAVLAVTGAVAAMLWQRRDLVAFIKCQGYRRGILWRWLLWESAVLLGAGCLIGTGFGLCGQLLISHALAVTTGFPIVFDVGPLIALSNFALLTLAALAIVAVAGFLVVRVPPRTVSPAY
jgi:putative ABC transport system permease protein